MVDLRKDPEKFSFDKWKMALKSQSREFVLRDQVTVTYTPDDESKLQAPGFTVVMTGVSTEASSDTTTP